MPPKKSTAAKKAPAAPAKVVAAPVSTEEVAPVAAGAKKKVSFDAPVAVVKTKNIPAGVVVPTKKLSKAPAKRERPTSAKLKKSAKSDKDRNEEDDESSATDDESSDEEDDLSLLADSSSSDDDDDDAARKKPRTEGGIRYNVLQLRFLPPAFQESELSKFLGQFGARVTNCFCVRSKRTKESKGTAYVQFDNEAVLPVVLEECNGMALGGRTIRARIREMHRPMPSKPNIRTRRLQGARHQAHGPKLAQHNVSGKSIVAQLVKATRAERKNNEALKKMGIDFSSSVFAEQLSRVPKDLLLDKAGRQAMREKKLEAAAAMKKAPGAATKKTDAVKADAKVVAPAPAPAPVPTPSGKGIVVPASKTVRKAKK